jgi:hypothetical protein
MPAGTIFVCEAIRTFPEIEQESVDVYNTYYLPYEVTAAAFKADAIEGACIITIISQDQNTVIHVPDTYILYCPTDDLVSQDHIVLSASLGILPAYYDLLALRSTLSSKVSEVLGITTTFHENRAISVGAISPTDNDIAEAAREANKIFQRSPEAELRDANAKIANLQTLLDNAYQVMRANGLITDV